MLVAAVVCPHPPLLVPAVAAGAAEETGELRAACLDAVRRLTATPADRLVVIGGAEESGEWDARAGGSLAGFGVPAAAGGPSRVLPLSLVVGAWLLDAVGAEQGAVRAEQGAVRAEQGAVRAERSYVAIAADTPPGECARVGADLTRGPDRVALLAMGDGSAKRSTASPGYVDPRAIDIDRATVDALSGPDPDGLLALDPTLAADLWVAGRPAWQALAGAARTSYTEHPDLRIDARLTHQSAPYGVGYVVVEWQVKATDPVT